MTSAADDSNVAVWDLRTSERVFSTNEPSLALTSFTSHYERPFTYYSSHFDASIMQWSLLDQPDIGLSQIKLLLGNEQDDVICDVHDLMNHQISFKLTGNKSRLVYGENLDKDRIDATENTLDMFQVVDGSDEFWAMIRILNGEGPTMESEKLRINHI